MIFAFDFGLVLIFPLIFISEMYRATASNVRMYLAVKVRCMFTKSRMRKMMMPTDMMKMRRFVLGDKVNYQFITHFLPVILFGVIVQILTVFSSFSLFLPGLLI